MYSSDEEGFGFGRAWTSKSSPQNGTNNIGDNVEAENFDKQQTESNQMMRMNEKGSGRDWSSHNYPSSSSRLRNRSRSPVNYSSKRERSRSRSPARRYNRRERDISPPRQHYSRRVQPSEPVNPIVAKAFENLVTTASLGMKPGQNELLSFKQFISQLDENLDEHESVKQYLKYKKKFLSDMIHRFFKEHKTYEWFKKKYDPNLAENEAKIMQRDIKSRLEVFTYLFDELNLIKNTPVEYCNQEKIVDILESASVMIEGGTIDMLPEINLRERSGMNNLSGDKAKGIQSEAPGSLWEQFAANKDVKNENEDPQAIINDNKDDVKIENKTETYHKNLSIFIPDFPEKVSTQELHNFAVNYDSFKRLHIQEPIYYKNWASRAWLTFQGWADIHKICVDLSNYVFSCGSSVNAVVGKKMENQIRPISGLTNHKSVMVEDLRTAVKLIILYDHRWGLFNNDIIDLNPDLNKLTVSNGNPLLNGVEKFIVNEQEAADDNLSDDIEKENNTNPYRLENLDDISTRFEVDDQIKSVLDPIIFYLRIVHSIDFYSGIKVDQESLMPYVTGIFHTRGDFFREYLRQKDVKDYKRIFDSKIGHLLKTNNIVNDGDLDFISFKSKEEAVNDYINSKSRELAIEKWHCLICDKKFRDSNFLTKHIHNKHSEILDQICYETDLFNNYLRDKNRPTDLIQGLGQLESGKAIKSSKYKDSYEDIRTQRRELAGRASQMYDNAVSQLSSNPFLLATLINQTIVSSSGENGARGYGGRSLDQNSSFKSGLNFSFNAGLNNRSMIDYTDMDVPNV